MMKTLVEKTGPCRKKITLEFPAEEVRRAYDLLLAVFAKSASLPGFRPGRAPKALVENRYRDELLKELRDELLPRGYQEARRQEKLDVVNVLDLNEPTLAPDAAATYVLTVETAPEFALPEYKGLRLKGEKTEVAETQVDEALEAMRREYGKYEEVADRPVADQDLARINFVALMDGRPLSELGPGVKGLDHGEDFMVHIGPYAFLPAVAEGLKGMRVGEKKNIEAHFDEKFPARELAGKTVTYQAELKGLRGIVPAEFNGEFFKRFDVENLDALRQRLRRDLEQDAAAREERRLRDEIMRRLQDAAVMDLPESLVQEETQRLVYETVRSGAARGAREQEIVQHKQEIFEGAGRTAAQTVKWRYLAQRIAEAEKIEATDDDLRARIEMMAAAYGQKPDALRAQLEKNDRLDWIRRGIVQNKVMDFLRREAVVEAGV